jgi:hypothetical protein
MGVCSAKVGKKVLGFRVPGSGFCTKIFPRLGFKVSCFNTFKKDLSLGFSIGETTFHIDKAKIH